MKNATIQIRLLFLFSLAVQFANAQTCFDPKQSYIVDINTYSICKGDFNNDGIIDLVAVNLSGTASLLMGDGLGGFNAATNFTIGVLPRSICAADFNNDGNLDLATTNTGPGNVSVLLGNGMGGFTNGAGFSTGIFGSSSRIAAADLNGDTLPDLVITSGFNYVIVALGNGMGGFSNPIHYTADNGTQALTLADLNGDSKIDIAVVTYNAGSHVSILSGTGTGTFGAATNYSVGASPSTIIVADFNGDGKADLATANTENNVTGSISILMGNGLGSFSAASTFGVGASILPRSIGSGDFNGDGNTDLAIPIVANNSNPGMIVLTGNGTGAFSNPTNFLVDSFPNAIVCADFNSDGKLDIAVSACKTNIDTGKVSVLLNCNTVGIDQIGEVNNGFSLFPNPCDGNFTLHSKSTLPSIEIYNAIGALVFTSMRIPQRKEINISGLAAGVYCIRSVDEKNAALISKLVVQ